MSIIIEFNHCFDTFKYANCILTSNAKKSVNKNKYFIVREIKRQEEAQYCHSLPSAKAGYMGEINYRASNRFNVHARLDLYDSVSCRRYAVIF